MNERPKLYDFALTGPKPFPDLIPIAGVLTYARRISKYNEGCRDYAPEPIDWKGVLNVSAVVTRNMVLGFYHVSAIPLAIRVLTLLHS